jgi:hypothetical protein
VSAKTPAHEHYFPFATHGVLSSVSPCECGKTCDQDYADRTLADALAAMDSAYPDGLPADLAEGLRVRNDSMWERAYMDVQAVLDKALGTREEDGAGEGIAADVALLVRQRNNARTEAERLSELVKPGLFPSPAAIAEAVTAERERILAVAERIKETHQQPGSATDEYAVPLELLRAAMTNPEGD